MFTFSVFVFRSLDFEAVKLDKADVGVTGESTCFSVGVGGVIVVVGVRGLYKEEAGVVLIFGVGGLNFFTCEFCGVSADAGRLDSAGGDC